MLAYIAASLNLAKATLILLQISIALAAYPKDMVITTTPNASAFAQNPPVLATSTQSGIFTSPKTEKAELQEMVIKEAENHGVDASLALFVVTRESNWNPLAVGDQHLTCPKTGEPIRSRGLFQINNCSWPEVDDETAFSPVSSTLWAMPRLLTTPQIWTVFRWWR